MKTYVLYNNNNNKVQEVGAEAALSLRLNLIPDIAECRESTASFRNVPLDHLGPLTDYSSMRARSQEQRLQPSISVTAVPRAPPAPPWNLPPPRRTVQQDPNLELGREEMEVMLFERWAHGMKVGRGGGEGPGVGGSGGRRIEVGGGSVGLGVWGYRREGGRDGRTFHGYDGAVIAADEGARGPALWEGKRGVEGRRSPERAL